MPMIPGDSNCTTGLAKDIWDIISGAGYPGEKVDEESSENYNFRKEALQKVCYAIASAVISHITSNATVNVDVTSVSGVQTGPGTSGPGTGTGTIS